MNNNINDNITRFNGQYLKCVVSNYTSSKNYLANSGSLIVIQPKSGKLNDVELEKKYNNGTLQRNYVYLGNEFLASGFGFGSQYLLEKAEHIINVYDDDIENLRKKDNELDKKINEEVKRLRNELNKYVKTNGGHIENTVINLNGINIKTSDIILYGEEAQYKNLEVNKVDVSINGNICKDETVFMPIGSYLKYVNIDAEISKNDSGGISDLEVLHNLEQDDETYEGTKIKYDLDSDTTLDYDYSLYKIFYSKNLETDIVENKFLIDSYKKEVLKSFYIHVKPTPVTAYKYYPGIYKKYGIKIVSSGNAIQENLISLNKKINIRPQYYAKYSEKENGGNLNDSDFTKVFPLNSFVDYDDTIISFDINDSNNRLIYVAVPINFKVNKIFILQNHTEKFNWTGAVSIIRNRKMTCVDTGTTNDTTYYINYDIYCLETNNGFVENSSIELHIKYGYVKDLESIDNDYSINLPKKISEFDNSLLNLNIANVDTINDEDFNDIYWINYEKTYNSNKDDLINKLNLVSINGVKSES